MAKKAKRLVSSTQKDLGVYGKVLDICHDRRWVTELYWTMGGWTLDVYDKDEDLLARGTSKKTPPDAFAHAARVVHYALQSSGKLP